MQAFLCSDRSAQIPTEALRGRISPYSHPASSAWLSLVSMARSLLANRITWSMSEIT